MYLKQEFTQTIFEDDRNRLFENTFPVPDFMKDLVIVRKWTMSNDFYRKSGRAIEDFTFDDNYSGEGS